MEAYDLYLQARALRVQGPPGIVQGTGIFEQAIAADPSFAPAYAGLGSAYALRSIQFQVDHAPDELQKMRTAADKAIELDPLLADAHEALGLVYSRYGQFEPVDETLSSAIPIDS